MDLALHALSARQLPPPDTMGGAFELLARERIIDGEVAERMKRAVGFRNLAVHNYEAINWAIVLAIATRHPDDFERFAKGMAKRLAHA